MKVFPLALNVLAALIATVAAILFIANRGEKLRAFAELSKAQGQIESLEAERAALKARSAQDAASLAALTKKADDLQASLFSTRLHLNDTASSLAQSQNMLIVKDQNISALNGDLATLKGELADARTRLQEIPRLKARVDELEQALALATHRVAPDGGSVPASATALYRVMAVGPESSFIVVNYGQGQGAKRGQRLIVRRGTDLIAVALISEVRGELSIAQVDPHAFRTALHTGDSIVLAQ